jgi:aminomethyltransferase
MGNDLKRTAFYQWHVDHGGRMVPFAGWEIPVQYPAGPLQEHHATRQVAGLFDIDHMGQVEVRGPQAEAFVNWIVTYDVMCKNRRSVKSGLCTCDAGSFQVHKSERIAK